jgi:thiol-disulfide isomerase/thioredoxin
MTAPRRSAATALAVVLALTSALALAQAPGPPPAPPPAAIPAATDSAPAAPRATADTAHARAAVDTTHARAAADTTRAHPDTTGAQAPKPTAPAPTTAPSPAPAPGAAATPPPSPVSGMRNKIAAGDLLSAESILEVHREKYGENGPWLVGMSWLARGAFLMGDFDKARKYTGDVRARCDQKRAAGDSLEKDHDLETALGAAIETEAQLVARSRGNDAAAAFLRSEITRYQGPVALRSRLYKRLNLLTLVGQKAPGLSPEDSLGGSPPALGVQPTLLFLWAEWCADCKGQAAALARARKRYGPQGLRVVALTRYYDPEPGRMREKARIDSVWKADYADLAGVPIVISTAAMERYGVSSTPTFAFIDRAGIVRRYTPTRLTDAEFERTLPALVKASAAP